MKYKKQDKKLFERLHNSEIGDKVVDLLERFQTHLCDSRNWSEDMNREKANYLADEIDEQILNKIKKRTEKKENSISRMSKEHE